MAEERSKAKRSSLPRIDTASSSAPTTTPAPAPAPQTDATASKERSSTSSEENSQSNTLEDRILSSVASSLSLSPDRLRQSFSQSKIDQRLSAVPQLGTSTRDKSVLGEDLTIKTQVIAGSKTLADVETKVVPYSAHSMSGSVIDTEGDEEESGPEKMDHENHDEDSDNVDDVPMRSASVMIAPERIHRASRMDSTRLRSARQDFDKHIRTPSMEDRPPMPARPIDNPHEVELFLGSEQAVSKVIILKPRAGLFDDELVACLTLSSIPPRDPESPKLDLIAPSQMFFAGTQIATIKQNLKNSRRIEAQAMPRVWIPLDSLPTMPENNEVDRRKLRTWVQNANQEVYERVMSLNTDQPLQHPTSEMERQVQKLVARVLQVPQEQVGMNFTFVQLGGGEVAAMALVTTSRVESIFLESYEILQPNNTLAHLATLASQRGGLAHKCTTAEQTGGPIGGLNNSVANFFDLSPMQKLYFSTRMGGDRSLRGTKDGSYRFNQSLLFRVAKGLTVNDISAATDAVVGHHAMLRARFGMVGDEWVQIVLPQVEGSYSFMHYTVSTNHEVESIVHSTQASINVEEGPLFAVAHLQTTDGHQMIYLAAHHLVVDVASWRLIIQDLDELLQHGSLLSQRAMPFQKWTELQKLDAQMPSGGLPFEICPGDLDYWGLRDSPNAYADAIEASITLSEELTSILEMTCTQILNTDPVDIYIAALLLSFAQTFPDRQVPDVWNQEHGRDLWSNDIDISETVGWFTTLCPLSLQIGASSDFVDVLRRLKDIRRAIPSRGAHYFASKFFPNNESNANADGVRSRSPNFLQIATQDWPIEILFSYAGNIQSLSKDLSQGGSVLEQMDMPGRTLHPRTSDIGPAVGRIAVFEVNTTMDHGVAKIKFLYNRKSLHTDKIATWIQNYEHLLFEAIGRLRFADPELTLSDIPQLWATGMTYDGLAKLNRTITADLGLNSVKEVEAVYPVTPLQQSILISQARQLPFPEGSGPRSECNGFSYVPNVSQNGNANACHIHTMYEFASPNGFPIDLERICAAWSQVVARYSALRTVFIESVTEEGLFDAVVLKRASPNMLFLDATPSEDPVDTLNNLPPLTACPALKSVPRHRLTVCHSPMKTVVKLDVSAALCDMMSVNGLIADLRRGYVTGRALSGAAGDATGFSYSGYLDIMRGLDRERSIAWWTNTLSSISQPCLFPKLDFYYNGNNTLTADGPRRYDNAHIEMADVLFHRVAEFGRAHKTTTGTILRLAWGLVLRCISGMNAVCFGYRAPGRSATLEGMRSAVGCFANTIAVSFDLSPFKPLGIMLRQIEDAYNAALPHQHITMAEVRHALAITGKGEGMRPQLFNTCFTFTEEAADHNSRFTTQTNCELRNILNHETTDYDLTIHTRFSSATDRLVVDIGHCILSDLQAHNIAYTFGRAVSAILECASPSTHLGAIDLFSDRDNAQIINWTNPADKEAQQQRTLLHELVFAQSITHPDAQAVCAHDGDLTYVQIEQLSHRLAHILLDAGVVSTTKGKVAVPVILDKSKWAPVALLAVLKVGAAFVPVDADEMGLVSKIAEQLGPGSRVAIACTSAAEALEDMNFPVPLFDRVICLNDALLERLHKEVPTPGQLLPPSNPDDVACIFFSLTSSRSVRGISFTHTALSTAFISQGPAAGLNSTTRVLQLSSFNVDVALSEIFTTLVNGGVICIPTSRDRYNDYTGCVTRFNANWSYMTPLLARKLNVELLPTLKTVCFRTRGLDEDTYAPWKGRKRVIMAYGAPEVCPLGISFLEIHGPHHLRAIGRPIAGSAWIVSCEDHRNLMPVGAVGEMVIEGPTLGKTFRLSSMTLDGSEVKDSAETPLSPESRSPFTAANAETHKKTPSISTAVSEDQSQGKKRYYKTGHSVRYIEGGLMEYVASKRDDVEINGRVVNLADLERHIRRALGQGADVMVEALTFKGERDQQPTLAAFLELGSDVSLAHSHSLDLTNPPNEVKKNVFAAKQIVEKFLAGVVPEFMIPKIFIPVRHLPTTYSLKVNRRKLQKVIKGMSREQLISLGTVDHLEQAQDDRGSKPLPVSGLESRVRAIWAEVLRIAEGTISTQDGFVKLGGDEISATQVVVRCRKERLEISISDLMRDLPLVSVCRSGGYYDVPPDQVITTTATTTATDDTSEMERNLDSAIQSIHQEAGLEQQVPASPTAATASAPQITDKRFIEETLALKLNLETKVIRDIAEATSTQIRSMETAILSQATPRSASSSPHGPGLTNIHYFVFHFTAPSSTSALSARRIEEVCQILTSIHPILRTAFIPHVEGQTRKVYQVVLKNYRVEFRHISRVQSWRLSTVTDKEIKRDRERLINAVELFSRPITKFFFLDAGKTSTLVLRLSKAQYDDSSITLLMKDLRKLYDGGQNPPRRPGFADFVREAALAQVGGEAEKYWRGLLEGANPTQVIRHAKPPKLSSSSRTLRETVFVNTTTMGGLGIALDTVLKAAWGMVLATISGTSDVVFGEIVEGCHSRLQHHLGPSSVNRGGVLGPASTVLPVRIRFADAPTSPFQLLKCVADQRTAGVPYENLGMLDIVEKCTPWPYWTRLSTVVQHRTDPELLVDGRTTSFRLGSALCKVSVVDSEVLDIPDLLVRSFVKSKKNVDPPEIPMAEERDKPVGPEPEMGGLREIEEELEISVSFCEQRVPANLAQEVLNKLCGYVGLLTGFSIMQNVVPTAAQYSALAKQIPLSTPMSGSSPTSAVGGVTFNNPFGGGAIRVNFAQMEAKMIPEQTTTIQSTIEEAWRAILDPRTLGVPEEHVTGAAFYDLWGSLIPAAQLADYLTYAIPSRLVGDLGGNLFGGNLDGFRIHMEEIVDNPTMLGQFELVVRKAFGGEGRERPSSLKSRSNSLPHSVRKSNSLTNITDGVVRKSTVTDKMSLVRSGTVALHGPSKLGHSRTRSDATEKSVTSNASSNDGSPGMSTVPVFPVHPAVAPPINQHHAHAQAVPLQRERKDSDASNATQNTGMTGTASTAPGSAYTAPTTISNTPPSSYTSPNASELAGSAIHPLMKLSNNIRATEPAELSPESPVLGAVNLAASPPVVQTGFVAARKKTNFGLGSSLRRIASNALRPGLQNSHSSGSIPNMPRSPPPKAVPMVQTPPKSSGSDKSAGRDKDVPSQPVSPWSRVQSMAPQLPPFPPFTPVTEDAFSMNGSAYTSSESRYTATSLDFSQGSTSANTSPEQILQQINGKVDHVGNFFGTLEVGLNGESFRATSGGGTDTRHIREGLKTTEEEEEDGDDEEEESTLRPHQVQKYLAASGVAQPSAPPAQETTKKASQQQQQQQKVKERRRRTDQPLVPSPVTETFYMEEDDESEAEGESVDDSQYDSYEEFDEDAQTPRPRDQRPITIIHSPQGTKHTANGATEDVPKVVYDSAQVPNHSQQPSSQPTLSTTDATKGEQQQQSLAPSAPATRTETGNQPGSKTDVYDLASLEAAEMDDTVSPLTPVERAMLYKQQAAQGLHRTPSRLAGGGGIGIGVGRSVNNVSPLTPGSYFVRQGQTMSSGAGAGATHGVVNAQGMRGHGARVV